MEVTREDMKEFLTWLDTTSDDFEQEVAKHDVRETFKECFGVEVSAEIVRTLSRTPGL